MLLVIPMAHHDGCTGAAAVALRNKAAAMRGAEQANAYQRAQELEARATQAVLDRADVVASTCVGLGEQRLEGRNFDVCIVDEASQVTEPDTLVAVTKVLPLSVHCCCRQTAPSTQRLHECVARRARRACCSWATSNSCRRR